MNVHQLLVIKKRVQSVTNNSLQIAVITNGILILNKENKFLFSKNARFFCPEQFTQKFFIVPEL